jgi:putative hydrolase of the HAD superfamily
MIKNIIFDMGNVLTIYNAREHIMKYVDNENDFYIIANQVCASVEWIKMDRGTLTDEEAVQSICKRTPVRLHNTISRFISEFRIEQPENLPMEELVKKLKDSEYKLYLFSNTAHRFHKFSKNIKSIEYMDGIWISCEHGYLKPEPDAFNSFFQKFQLKPSECFFIDDSPANIEASLRMGMKGCVYHKDVHELEEDLRLAGV